jgi:hypothetical protein
VENLNLDLCEVQLEFSPRAVAAGTLICAGHRKEAVQTVAAEVEEEFEFEAQCCLGLH